jgi:hypothetical protein
MKKGLLILFISTLNIFNTFSQTVSTNSCITTGGGGGGGGNLVIFANYDGGVLNINCDQNIPNLKIGICTYEPTTINLTGPFVGNVTEVRYAGYVSTSNHHCSNSPTTTTIVGAPGGATTSVNFLPPATSSNPNGYSMIVCAYSCDTTTNQGGCNTADQIVDYFESTMGATLYSYFTQYGCWSTTPYNVSAGGNCTFSGTPDTTTATFSTSSSTVCAGAPVNFIDLSPGAVSWSWSSPGANTTSSSSQNYSGVVYNTMGTYTVTLSTNDGGGTCSTTQTITVLPQPTLNLAANPNPICPGDTSILFANGASSYLWGGGPSGTVYQVHPTISTWYDVTGTDVNGCTKTDSVQVIVYSAPSTPTINYGGGILTASPTALSYQWYLNGNPISGATNQNYTPTQNGVYTVTYTDANGCTSAQSLVITISDIGVGVIELDGKIQVYPNPGTGIFQIKNQNASGDAIIEVYDIQGRMVYFKEIQFYNSYTLDLSEQPKGAYEVRMRMGDKTGYAKLILK